MTSLVLNHAAVQSIYDAVMTHIEQAGVLDGKPLPYPPFAAPPPGLSCAFTGSQIRPIPGGSGLDATSLLWEIFIRLYQPWQDSRNQAAIDPRMDAASFAILASFAGDINLTGAGVAAGLVRDFKALAPVTQLGGADIGGTQCRVRDLTIQIEINDAFAQAGA